MLTIFQPVRILGGLNQSFQAIHAFKQDIHEFIGKMERLFSADQFQKFFQTVRKCGNAFQAQIGRTALNGMNAAEQIVHRLKVIALLIQGNQGLIADFQMVQRLDLKIFIQLFRNLKSRGIGLVHRGSGLLILFWLRFIRRFRRFLMMFCFSHGFPLFLMIHGTAFCICMTLVVVGGANVMPRRCCVSLQDVIYGI